MSIMKKMLVAFAAAAVMVTGAAAQNAQINGAGATFPFVIYSKWFDEIRTSCTRPFGSTINRRDREQESAR